MLSSLESIGIVTTVVDKVSKETQLLALPAGLHGSCCLCLLTRRGVVRRCIKIGTIESTSVRVIYIACWSHYFPESVREGYIGARYSSFYYFTLAHTCGTDISTTQSKEPGSRLKPSSHCFGCVASQSEVNKLIT